jgi:methylenetetrahydrofolate--tRNA-(uracil-5-)-methyltransferase
MSREQYESFISALVAGDKYQGHDFDQAPYFEGCLPVEEMAARGRETLRFGPLKPVGLRDPHTGRDAYAVVQLRQEDRAGRMWNLVGFQTRLRIGDQEKVFRSIPGLAKAEFLRHGSIHRNSYVNSPAALTPALTLRDDEKVFLAGQITGAAAVIPPGTTMLGALYRYLREADPAHFQPMNANFGLLDDLSKPERDKRRKRELFAARALADIESWKSEHGIHSHSTEATAEAGAEAVQ